jgi:hypothetical protein
MALATVLIYILLVLGIALVALGVFVVARQLLQRVAPAGPQGPYLSALVIVIGIASMGTSGVPRAEETGHSGDGSAVTERVGRDHAVQVGGSGGDIHPDGIAASHRSGYPVGTVVR